MLNEVIKVLNESHNISIYTHINTDCDALGSALALKEAMNGLGKNVDIYIHSNFPVSFEFFGDLSFINQKTIEGKYDLAVCVDCATEARLGKYKFVYRKGIRKTLNIDHHSANELFCKVNYVKQASSTAEILFEILDTMKIRFTDTMCKNLLSGIMTDTGKFSHGATSKTLVIVSKLLRFGKIKIEDVSVPLFSSMTMDSFELLKKVYEKIEFFANNKLAVIVLSRRDFIDTNTTLDDTDPFPDVLLQLKSVQFGILASEDDKGYFRVSFRSKGDISARAVAETFGGGGHPNASGCKIFGSFVDVKDQLINNTLQTLGWEND